MSALGHKRTSCTPVVVRTNPSAVAECRRLPQHPLQAHAIAAPSLETPLEGPEVPLWLASRILLICCDSHRPCLAWPLRCGWYRAKPTCGQPTLGCKLPPLILSKVKQHLAFRSKNMRLFG